jgi:hypothetical protein
MQNQMQEKILETLINYLQNTESFVIEQMPEIISQTLKYEKMSCIMGLSTSIFFMILAVSIGCYFLINPTLESYGNRSMASFMGACLPLTLSLMLLTPVCAYIDKLVKINLAPKYFLIKLFMEMK